MWWPPEATTSLSGGHQIKNIFYGGTSGAPYILPDDGWWGTNFPCLCYLFVCNFVRFCVSTIMFLSLAKEIWYDDADDDHKTYTID